jgi:hypothetical protein
MLQLSIIIAVSCAVSFGGGWMVNGWKHDAAEKIRAEAYVQAMTKKDKENRELAKKYQEAQANTRIVYRTIEKRVKDETSNRACLDAGAVWVWNSALWGLPETATGTAEAASKPDTATDREVLGNAVENMAQYKECRDQLNALIDWHDKN